MVVAAAQEGVPVVAYELAVVGALQVAAGTPASLDASEYMLVEHVDVFASLALLSGYVSLLSNYSEFVTQVVLFLPEILL